jgi:hypothetical protein
MAQALAGDQGAPSRTLMSLKSRSRMDRAGRGAFEGFEHVAPVAGGDVEDAARAPGGLQAGQGQAQEFLEVQLALADAAPADGVEVAGRWPARWGRGRRGVAIDVVEGAAGVEAGLMAQAHALGEQAAELHVGPVGRPVQRPRAEPRQRAGEGVGLVAGRAEAVGVAQVGGSGGLSNWRRMKRRALPTARARSFSPRVSW